MDIYVGNLSFDASEDDVRGAFATFGTVESVKMIMDRETGRPRGFAFVNMTESDEANTAIESLNGSELLGRELRVREATPRPERPRGGGGYGGGGYGGGGYSGGGGEKARENKRGKKEKKQTRQMNNKQITRK